MPVEPPIRRRAFGVAALLLVLALGVVALGLSDRVQRLQGDIRALQGRVRQLSYNTASGGGVNLKLMPDPRTGLSTVPLYEVFSFDRNHAICRVETNPQAFQMMTHQLGEVIIPAHQFFMSMTATTVDQYTVTALPDGTRRVAIRGGLSCATEIGLATVTIGSRSAAEHATYLIEAVDAGIGGGQVGDCFAFAAFFDPHDAPVNYKIFGSRAIFTGRMIEGKITIVSP
jgi:hypothetical protein